ncbi:hypothetical protein Csp1_22050 [Corynebacterium provencense]|uniref:Uncharacterized protein n=2 Tax=Corynebacterium provencense TaxID=1737425 RepID=A0A2Z3YQD3_9CORY|nr:hypothetical protein Csp1_22050 [Corynebacterium provencense]
MRSPIHSGGLRETINAPRANIEAVPSSSSTPASVASTSAPNLTRRPGSQPILFRRTTITDRRRQSGHPDWEDVATEFHKSLADGDIDALAVHSEYPDPMPIANDTGLAASTVAGPLNPGHHRDPQLFTCGPTATVEDVDLKQREEGLHGGVVTAGTEPAHRSDHAVTVRDAQKLPASTLRTLPTQAMHPAASPRIATALSRTGTANLDVIVKLIKQPTTRPGEGGVDRAGGQPAFRDLVFGDVHEPELVHPLDSEHMSGTVVLINDGAAVVMDSVGPGRSVPRFFPDTLHQPVARCDGPRGPVHHNLTGVEPSTLRSRCPNDPGHPCVPSDGAFARYA